MHVRLSAMRGVSVVDDQTQHAVAVLSDALLDPDTGRILGFFVFGFGIGASGDLFIVSHDILSWGENIHIRSVDVLTPPRDLIRLQKNFKDSRLFLGQSIRIEGSKKSVGTCADVQFDTRHLVVEWLFPRRFFWYRQPIPASDIFEVTNDAIWIRDPRRTVKEPKLREDDQSKDSPRLPEIAPVSSRLKNT